MKICIFSIFSVHFSHLRFRGRPGLRHMPSVPSTRTKNEMNSFEKYINILLHTVPSHIRRPHIQLNYVYRLDNSSFVRALLVWLAFGSAQTVLSVRRRWPLQKTKPNWRKNVNEKPWIKRTHNKSASKPQKRQRATSLRLRSQVVRCWAAMAATVDGTKEKKINFSVRKPNQTELNWTNSCRCCRRRRRRRQRRRRRHTRTHASKQINSAYIPHTFVASVENDVCIYGGRHEYRMENPCMKMVHLLLRLAAHSAKTTRTGKWDTKGNCTPTCHRRMSNVFRISFAKATAEGGVQKFGELILTG